MTTVDSSGGNVLDSGWHNQGNTVQRSNTVIFSQIRQPVKSSIVADALPSKNDVPAEEKHTHLLNTSLNELNPRPGSTTFATNAIPRSGAYEEKDSREGVVLRLAGNLVHVRLTDPSRTRNDEDAEFLVADVSTFDRDLLKPGATFYWTVGTWRSTIGAACLISQIRFRRLPNWSANYLEQATIRAEQLKSLFS